MTPNEKAKELVNNYKPFVYCYSGSGMLSNDYDENVAKDNAKKCALIALDEIIKHSPNKPIEKFDPIDYFKKVKIEINNI